MNDMQVLLTVVIAPQLPTSWFGAPAYVGEGEVSRKYTWKLFDCKSFTIIN